MKHANVFVIVENSKFSLAAPRRLSIAPLHRLIFSRDRPVWRKTGPNDTHRFLLYSLGKSSTGALGNDHADKSARRALHTDTKQLCIHGYVSHTRSNFVREALPEPSDRKRTAAEPYRVRPKTGRVSVAGGARSPLPGVDRLVGHRRRGVGTSKRWGWRRWGQQPSRPARRVR